MEVPKNIVQCEKGHWYDGDKYDVCPHCGEKQIIGEKEEKEKENKKSPSKKFSLFPKKDRKQQKKNSQNAENQDVPTRECFDGEDSSSKKPSNFMEDEPTVAADWLNKESEALSCSSASTRPLTYANSESEEFFSGIDDDKTRSMFSNPVDELRETEQEDAVSAVKSETLSEAIDNSTAYVEGKTLSFFQAAVAERSGFESLTPINRAEPATGWLVCIKGNHFGESFQLVAGKNSIGRNSDNQIVLAGDNEVSRDRHAAIVYEPKKRQFFLVPGEGRGLTYLNDEYISSQQRLTAYDVIEVGGTKMAFIPLCGEKFSWEDYLNE